MHAVQRWHRNLWIMFDHIKWRHTWTVMTSLVYDKKILQVFKNSVLWYGIKGCQNPNRFLENLNVVILENYVPHINFKGFMANNAQDNKMTMRRIYSDGDPSAPLEGREHTCIFHWSINLDKIIQKIHPTFIAASTQTTMLKSTLRG